LAREDIHVDGGLLTAVRVAQNHNGVVRVVLDVNGVKDYAASLTNNPPQLVIDLYGNSPAAPVRTAKGKRTQQDGAEDWNGVRQRQRTKREALRIRSDQFGRKTRIPRLRSGRW